LLPCFLLPLLEIVQELLPFPFFLPLVAHVSQVSPHRCKVVVIQIANVVPVVVHVESEPPVPPHDRPVHFAIVIVGHAVLDIPHHWLQIRPEQLINRSALPCFLSSFELMPQEVLPLFLPFPLPLHGVDVHAPLLVEEARSDVFGVHVEVVVPDQPQDHVVGQLLLVDGEEGEEVQVLLDRFGAHLVDET